MYIKFEDFGSHRSQAICDKKLIGEKEKWVNKGNDKQEEADYLLQVRFINFIPMQFFHKSFHTP